MANDSRPNPHPASVFFYNLSLMLTGGLVLIGLLVGTGFLRDGATLMGGLRRLLYPQDAEPQVDVESIVVQQVQGVSELTTAIFAMQAVVPTQRDRTFAGYTVGSTTLLYIAHGEVRAGVDLATLTPDAVQLTGGNGVQIQLPPPQILDSKIDVNRSRVYDYDRGFLGLGPDAAPELQQLAQQQTLQEIVATACSEGILQEANARAELAVRQLLLTTGYDTVTVVTQAPAPETCPTVTPTAAPAPALPPATPIAPALPAPEALPQQAAPPPLPAEPLPAEPLAPTAQPAPTPPLG